MGDHVDTTPSAPTPDAGAVLGPPAPLAPSPGRRWLRWGSVYVDIEPPTAANPWTASGWGAPPDDVLLDAPAPVPPTPWWRRPGVLFAAAAVATAVLAALLVLAFGRHDTRPVLFPAITTTVARPRQGAAPTTVPAAPPANRPTAPAPTTPVPSGSTPVTTAPGAGSTTTPAPGRSTSSGGPAVPGTGGGPITIPEGVPVPTTAPTAPAPTTPAPTTAPATTAPGRAPTTTAAPRAFLGVTVEESADGPHIVDIFPDSGAQRAGLLPNDVITAVDSTPVATNDELGAAITSHRPGESIVVTVLRNGATVTVRATLGSR